MKYVWSIEGGLGVGWAYSDIGLTYIQSLKSPGHETLQWTGRKKEAEEKDDAEGIKSSDPHLRGGEEHINMHEQIDEQISS